jgi:hypothetical protein
MLLKLYDLIQCIKASDLEDDEIEFIVKNLKNLNDAFMKKFKREIEIEM